MKKSLGKSIMMVQYWNSLPKSKAEHTRMNGGMIFQGAIERNQEQAELSIAKIDNQGGNYRRR